MKQRHLADDQRESAKCLFAYLKIPMKSGFSLHFHSDAYSEIHPNL